jgi:hypothetical protein
MHTAYPNAEFFLAERTTYDRKRFLHWASLPGWFFDGTATQIPLAEGHFDLGSVPELEAIYGPKPGLLNIWLEGTICQKVFRIIDQTGEVPQVDDLPLMVGETVGFAIVFKIADSGTTKDYFIMAPPDDTAYELVETLLEESTKPFSYFWREPQYFELGFFPSLKLKRTRRLKIVD